METEKAATGVPGGPRPPGAFLRAADTRLHYVRAGDGPPVVYIHGAKGSVYDFLLSIGPRVAERYTALAVDRPGSGFSGRPPGGDNGPFAQAAILRVAAAELGVERPVLVGHSLGAAVALAWALDAPDEVAAVVTLGGYALPTAGPPPWVDTLLRSRTLTRATGALARSPLGRPLARAALKRAFEPGPVPADYARVAPALAFAPGNMEHDGADRAAADAAVRAMTARYPSLVPPLVILAGAGDRMIPPAVSERLHEMVPGSELVLVPGAGHLPQFTTPGPVLAAIDRAAMLGGLVPAPAFASASSPA